VLASDFLAERMKAKKQCAAIFKELKKTCKLRTSHQVKLFLRSGYKIRSSTNKDGKCSLLANLTNANTRRAER
jgi:predicted DNA-binding protein YlxM (UPF0122 family)